MLAKWIFKYIEINEYIIEKEKITFSFMSLFIV